MRNFYRYSFSLVGLLLSATATHALSVPRYEATDNDFPQLQQIVKDSGVEMGQFQSCLRNGSWVDSIQQSINEAQAAHIRGVPETLIFTDSNVVYRVPGADRTGLETLIRELKNNQTPSIPPVLLAPSVNPPDTNVEPGWGDLDAPIKLAVYVDFSCKFCRDLDKILLDLEEQYQGFIQITYRDYPLTSIHPQAFLLAHSAQCALDQNRYWDYLEQLYRWTPKTNTFSTQGLALPTNRGQYSLIEIEPFVQRLEVFNWFTGKTIRVSDSLDRQFPELAAPGVIMKALAEPNYPDSARQYAFFITENSDQAVQPQTTVYKLDKLNGVISRMKISSLLPANTGDIEVNTTETKLAWSPVKSGGVARELYVFDLIKDTRTLVYTLPAGQTFDKNNGELLNFSSDFEWFDEKTIGYRAYNAKTKAFITEGLIKMK